MQSVSGTAGTYSLNITNVTNPPSTRLYNVIPSAVFSDTNNNQLMSLPSTKFVILQNQLAANLLTYSLT